MIFSAVNVTQTVHHMLTVFGEDVLRISGFSLFLTLHAVAVHIAPVYILRSHIFCPRSFLTPDQDLKKRCHFHSDPRLAKEYSNNNNVHT